MMKAKNLLIFIAMAALLTAGCLIPAFAAGEEPIVLRICNWEEYIDLGDWDEEEDLIDLESGDIFSENPMIDDFEEWYAETYGREVRVEYSTFGTNEDLYNMLSIGDVYDLVCPSEYMIMKLMAEDMLVPLSDAFFDETVEENYYIRGVSPYIRKIFDAPQEKIGGKTWGQYAAGYMWGITGFVYNPEKVSEEDASTWRLLENRDYFRQITIKDNVRDAYFAAVGAIESDKLTSEAFVTDPGYAENLQNVMNNVDHDMIEKVQDYLQKIKDNLYSFETDSGKADMITGKVVANYQWSGDAVFTMDEADKDDYTLNFAVPRESTNIYFDGWTMLKCGVDGNADKQHAAEAFINFISRPDNAIRNMYYIGYTSTISASEDGRIFEYLNWNYGVEEEPDESEESGEPEENGKAEKTEEEITAPEAETAEPEEETAGSEEDTAEPEEETETVEYDLSYFFAEEGSEDRYVLTVDAEQLKRQLSAQYPSEEVIRRASIMVYFNADENKDINRMWVNVRCFNINSVPVWVWIALAVVIAGGIAFGIRRKIVKNRQYE